MQEYRKETIGEVQRYSIHGCNLSLREELNLMFSKPTDYIIVDNKRTLLKEKKVSQRFGTSYKAHIPPFTAEGMKFLLAIKKAKLAQRGISWNPRVIGGFDKDAIISIFVELVERPDFQRGSAVRSQVSVNILQHFVALDVEAFITSDREAGFRAVIIDASIDRKFEPLRESFRNMPPIKEFYEITGIIQHDNYGCPVTVANILANLRKIPNLFEVLASLAIDGKVHYSKLPLSLIKTMQALSDIEDFQIDQHKPFNKKSDTLASYIQKHRGYFLDDKPGQPRNFSVIDMFHKYAKEANRVLALLSDDELQQVIVSMQIPERVFSVASTIGFTSENVSQEHLTTEPEREFHDKLCALETSSNLKPL